MPLDAGSLDAAHPAPETEARKRDPLTPARKAELAACFAAAVADRKPYATRLPEEPTGLRLCDLAHWRRVGWDWQEERGDAIRRLAGPEHKIAAEAARWIAEHGVTVCPPGHALGLAEPVKTAAIEPRSIRSDDDYKRWEDNEIRKLDLAKVKRKVAFTEGERRVWGVYWAEGCNLRAAAERLGTSKANVTQTVARVTRRIGERLAAAEAAVNKPPSHRTQGRSTQLPHNTTKLVHTKFRAPLQAPSFPINPHVAIDVQAP